jgi:hypothetical protein
MLTFRWSNRKKDLPGKVVFLAIVGIPCLAFCFAFDQIYFLALTPVIVFSHWRSCGDRDM